MIQELIGIKNNRVDLRKDKSGSHKDDEEAVNFL